VDALFGFGRGFADEKTGWEGRGEERRGEIWGGGGGETGEHGEEGGERRRGEALRFNF